MNADAVAALPWGEYIAKLAATPCLAFREPWSCLNEPEEDGSPEAPMWERDELCPPCLVRAARAALAAAPLPSEPTHPHDGFAYDGCKCVCCVNIRALANPAIIEERDRAEEWADRLAYAIGGAAIGEHSNLNNPWQNALDMAAPLPSDTPARTVSFDSVNATGRPSDTPADELDEEREISLVGAEELGHAVAETPWPPVESDAIGETVTGHGAVLLARLHRRGWALVPLAATLDHREQPYGTQEYPKADTMHEELES